MRRFFNRGGNLLQRVQSGDWSTDEERDELLTQMQERAKAGDLIPLLWHKQAAVRGAAVAAFTQKADAKSVSKLLGELENQSAGARSYAMKLIARLDGKVVEPAIEQGVKSALSGARRVAWECAVNLQGDLRSQYLTRAVKEAPGRVRQTALETLLAEHKPAELKDLLLELLESSEVAMQERASELLQGVRDPDVFNAMVTRFKTGAGSARERAGTYLRKYAKQEPAAVREHVLEMLAEGDDGTRRLSVEILMETAAPEEVLTGVLLFARQLAPWLRKRIMDTLRSFGDTALRPAVELLDHSEEDVRNAALALAEEFKDPRLVAPLSKLLTHEDWWLRITAADALGKLGSDKAVPALIKALEDEDARWSALDALARIGSPTALEPITKILSDERAEVRLEAVSALAAFKDRRVVPLLTQVADRDPALAVRTRATEIARDIAGHLQMESRAEAAKRTDRLPKAIDRMLSYIRDEGCSDLHLTPGEVPMVRRHGVLSRLDDRKATSGDKVERVLRSMVAGERLQRFVDTGDLDFCYAIDEVGRYRCNAYQTRLGPSLCFRVIPNMPPTFADLRLPGHLAQLTDYHQGIILVTGPAGSGKSTTLAALVNLINESKATHVITLEDPVEFVHPVKTALVNQREMGTHSESFARSLRGALRQDPDVIMVGELRDPEVTRMALEAAETGHLVISTMSTLGAVPTVERLVGSFPPDEQQQVRMGLSDSLKFVISQQLVPRSDGQGRVGIYEILKGTMAIGNLIREGKTHNIAGMMQVGRKQGMQTVDMALEDLVEKNLVSPEDAYVRARNPTVFEPLVSAEFLAALKAG